jgi:murein DD-endopeptidase MepM/ murein hydrolase activator NlpD
MDILDAVICPFDFARTGFCDWKGRWWGSDVYLYHPLGFRMRISHMYPDQIVEIDRLSSGFPVNKNDILGKAGDYGNTTGPHTHTEIESWGFSGEWLTSCQALDYILREKYQKDADIEYTDPEIWDIYETCERSDGLLGDTILSDYASNKTLRDGRTVSFANKHKIRLTDASGRVTTMYSSQSLFGF